MNKSFVELLATGRLVGESDEAFVARLTEAMPDPASLVTVAALVEELQGPLLPEIVSMELDPKKIRDIQAERHHRAVARQVCHSRACMLVGLLVAMRQALAFADTKTIVTALESIGSTARQLLNPS